MKILLGVDASPDSKHAAQMVKHFSPPLKVHLLHVVDIWSLKHSYLESEHSEADFEIYRQKVSKLSENLLHEIRDELAMYAQQIQLVADSGDPAECIIQTAEDVQPDLIILGHRGMTAKSSFLLGGVSQKVATYAPCSVLICKGPVPIVDSVLLAVDGSDPSDKAIEFLATGPFKGPLRVILTTVWDPPPLTSMDINSGSPASSFDSSPAKSKGEEFLNEVAGRIQKGNYEVKINWQYGDPPSAILESAEEFEVQMVVVGARGLKGIKRFFLGSVSQKVLMHGACSVLIVR